LESQLKLKSEQLTEAMEKGNKKKGMMDVLMANSQDSTLMQLNTLIDENQQLKEQNIIYQDELVEKES